MKFAATWILLVFLGHSYAQSVKKVSRVALHESNSQPAASPTGIPDKTSAKIPPGLSPAFFGLTVLNTHAGASDLQYGTARSWDSYPATDWADTNPLPGRYNFKPLDDFFSANKSKDTIFTLGRTPQWASVLPNNKDSAYGPGQCAPPENMATWDAYVRAVAKYVHGRTHYWELWNEPDGPQFYCGDMSSMVIMAQHAHSILKEVDPQAVLLSPPVTLDPGPKWLDSFLTAGGQNAVDIIAFHGYANTSKAEEIETIITNYQAVMAHHGITSKPLWDTEISWALNGVNRPPSETAQAAYIAKIYLLHWSHNVQRVVWYAYDASVKDGGLHGPDRGLSISARAYNETYKWLQGASLSTPCSHDKNDMWSCAIVRPGGYRAQVVWNSSSTTDLAPDASFHEYRDLIGVVHPLSGSKVVVGSLPILLENKAIPVQ